MTVDWLGLILYVGGGGALLIVTIWLVGRGEAHLGDWRGPGPGRGGAPQGPAGPAGQIAGSAGPRGDLAIAAYLDRMTSELRLPAADAAEVRAELADHLEDSIASLEADGFDREDAIREALGRLGPAAELGRQIRAAHQSTRRLLAGVGGGVFAAGGGFVLGYLGGFALAFGSFLVLAALGGILGRFGLPLPDLSTSEGSAVANSLFLNIILAVGAAGAVRYAVRTSAGLSRRTLRSMATFWAAAGVLVFGWLALFGMRGQQSWPAVAAALCIPLAAIAGGFVRIERPMPHVGRWAAIAIAVAVILPVVLLAAAGASSFTTTAAYATQFQESDFRLDHVAPMAPAAWLPADDFYIDGGDTDYSSGAVTVDAHFATSVAPDTSPTPLPLGPILTNWRDVRFEAWHAIIDLSPGSGVPHVDTSFSSPFLVLPAVVHDDSLQAEFHFERLRDARTWWIVPTATGPDGNRYRLSDGRQGMTAFNGSVWDWLTAPQ
jgi:HAAS